MTRAVRIWVAIAALLAVCVAVPTRASADCGGTVTVAAKHHRAGQIPPLAIGDSTMLLSLPGLAAAGYQANAHGCRELYQAIALLQQLRAQGRLPHMVTIALGSNCCIVESQLEQTLRLLGPSRLLVLVLPVQAAAADAAERAAAARHPNRIKLLDWVGESAGHPSWFQPDGLHLTLPGVAAFTRLLASVVSYAYVSRTGH